MSKLKNKIDSILLRDKFSTLLESIDRNNTSKLILDRHYSNISALAVSEGKIDAKSAYTELTSKGINKASAEKLITTSVLSEAKTSVADSYLLNTINILESAVKELKAYTWMPSIKSFVEESSEFLKENQTYILIESVIYDLELDRSKGYYTKAINSLRECSESDNPIFSVVEKLEGECWIPLVKRLYEFCNSQKGAVTGSNPNFKVSKIFSPVEAIDENTFVFHSKGKLIEIKEGSLTESTQKVEDNFIELVKLTESAKIGENSIRVYPNVHSTLDVTFGENPTVTVNGKVVESSNVGSYLLSSAIVRMNEQEKIKMIERAINEGSKIKEIDFGYSVTSAIYEGVSVSVFNINDKIYIQKVNKGMKENSLTEATNATEAVKMVKDFMNYDISNSLQTLVNEEAQAAKTKTDKVNKIEDRIKFIQEKFDEILASERVIGKSPILDKAKEILENQLKEQNAILDNIKYGKDLNEGCELGKEYKIDGKGGYIYQGVADGSHMFSSKSETDPTPLHMNDEEFQQALSSGKISK